jgi:hypothetical protein
MHVHFFVRLTSRVTSLFCRRAWAVIFSAGFLAAGLILTALSSKSSDSYHRNVLASVKGADRGSGSSWSDARSDPSGIEENLSVPFACQLRGEKTLYRLSVVSVKYSNSMGP